MQESIASKRLAAGAKTYFFDVKETKTGKKYLRITESRLQEEGGRLRNDIAIFSEYVDEFCDCLSEISKDL